MPYTEQHQPILDLEVLVKGKVMSRPSKVAIRSPYLADIEIVMNDSNDNNSSTTKDILAHAPALNAGGLCSIGSTVFCSPREGYDPKNEDVSDSSSSGKPTSSHKIMLAFDEGPECKNATNSVLVGIHPQIGESLAEKLLLNGLLEDSIGIGRVDENLIGKKRTKKKRKHDNESNPPQAPNTTISLRRQVRYGDSRVDFELTKLQNGVVTRKLLIEVKTVLCADYCKETAPKKRHPNHCVIPRDTPLERYKRSGLFPWGKRTQKFGPENKKVVSERAIKHIQELDVLQRQGENVESVILFILTRSDCVGVRPCKEACPVFVEELEKAVSNGVTATATKFHFEEDGKVYFHGIVPVIFDGDDY